MTTETESKTYTFTATAEEVNKLEVLLSVAANEARDQSMASDLATDLGYEPSDFEDLWTSVAKAKIQIHTERWDERQGEILS